MKPRPIIDEGFLLCAVEPNRAPFENRVSSIPIAALKAPRLELLCVRGDSYPKIHNLNGSFRIRIPIAFPMQRMKIANRIVRPVYSQFESLAAITQVRGAHS